jgi:hypothetical protein
MINHLIVNAYPRSGSVFFAKFLQEYRPDIMYLTSMHVPHIIDNKHLNSVVIFRDPYECMSSHLYMMVNPFDADIFDIDNKPLINSIEKNISQYDAYIDIFLENTDKRFIYGVLFDKMTSDPHNVAIDIFKKFNLEYDRTIHNSSVEVESNLIQNNEMDDKGGHMPRPKTKERLVIENFVSTLDILKNSFEKYKIVKDLLT